jgi:MFS family permease
VAQLALACAQASFFVYLALYLQEGRGLSPLDAGLVFTAVAVGYVAASGPAPALVERYGRAVVAAGGVFLAAGLGTLAVVVSAIGVTGSVIVLRWRASASGSPTRRRRRSSCRAPGRPTAVRLRALSRRSSRSATRLASQSPA